MSVLVQLQQFLSHVLGLAAYSHCVYNKPNHGLEGGKAKVELLRFEGKGGGRREKGEGSTRDTDWVIGRQSVGRWVGVWWYGGDSCNNGELFPLINQRPLFLLD